MYGNPEAILEAKQAQQAREKQQRKRGTLHAKPGWSEARRRAEALFISADSAVQPSTSLAHRNDGRPFDGEDS